MDPEYLLEPLPSANSPNDQDGNNDSSSSNEVESSASSERTKEVQIKEAANVDAEELPPIVEGTGDSASAAPSSSKPGAVPVVQRTPPASASTLPALNDLRMPIVSS